MTIDGEGHPDAVFIFQINGALTLAAGTHMLLVDEAQAKNVFWQVNGAGSIGANSNFVGTMMANAALDSGAGNTINGRLLTTAGALALGNDNDLYSAPPTLSIAGGATAYSATSAPIISGSTSVRSPSVVTVTIDGVADATQPVPGSAGAWTLTPSELLANGDHTIVASVVDGAANLSTFTQVLTVDTTPPSVTIDGGAAASTNDVSPTLTGTTDVASGETVTLTLSRTSPPVVLDRTALVQSDHTWSIGPNAFSAGEWTVVASVVDPAGNESSATQILTIDTTPPVATITSAALTNDPTPALAGTAELGSTVAVSIDGLGVAGLSSGSARTGRSRRPLRWTTVTTTCRSSPPTLSATTRRWCRR